ncbi:hypothetical protein [Vibrio sp. ER1A]|uniref:hypothetical protein n=1 Tax=Vibrio sp. ER1A TaxID=1517681 RepID=UPI0004DCC7A7|nr:hypothetical protein [Vibrio sp. ER1A]KFA98776.1 hypothetical protein HW45_07060 [Vibrio sp. ER1A]
MSLEQQVTALVDASNNLTGAVTGKISEIDQRVDRAENEYNQFKDDIQEYIPLPLNLFTNAMMRSVEAEGHPTGFEFVGCTLEAVHPYTKGFEGCYTGTAPSNVAPTPDSANESNPYWYGRYNLGPRMYRGGLSGGWGGISDGKILKITSTASAGSKFFRIPVETFGVFQKLGMRFWIKIVNGKVGMGNDNGLWSGSSNRLGNVIEKSEADTGDDGWFLVDKVISIAQASAVSGNVLNFGLPHDQNCEVYIALPFLYIPMAGKSMLVAAGETGGSPIFTPEG